jgi:hypothetical protein
VSAERQDPRTAVSHAPEWVGEGEGRRDVSAMNDRGIAVAALDAVLRVSDSLKRHSSAFLEFASRYEEQEVSLLTELPDHEQRIATLERKESRRSDSERPGARAERSSHHDWDPLLVEAGAMLAQRVKDPRDRMDSDRARAIAKEVLVAAATADDAEAFRSLKKRGSKIAWEVAKAVVVAAVGAAITYFTVHGH